MTATLRFSFGFFLCCFFLLQIKAQTALRADAIAPFYDVHNGDSKWLITNVDSNTQPTEDTETTVGFSSKSSNYRSLNNTCAFITTWQTTVPNEDVTIGVSGAGLNYNVDWGDGTIETGLTNNTATHNYATPGIHEVVITGVYPRFRPGVGAVSAASLPKLRSVEQWGCNPWQSMDQAFSNAVNLVVNAPDTPNLSNVTSMWQMFDNCETLGTGTGNWNWDTSNVQDMREVFRETDNFNKDVSFWDTSNVTTMEFMFQQAEAFNQDINAWDVSNVTEMRGMFQGASSFNQDLNNWNTSAVTRMNQMFWEATNFNGVISNWDTGNVTTMSRMFQLAVGFNQDISNWDVSNVTNMQSMFNQAITFNQDIGNWNTGAVIDMLFMFREAVSFDQDLGSWDVTSLTTAFGMFEDVQLSVANYDSLLIGWNAQNLNPNVSFSGGLSQYCAGEAARASMITNDNWSIIDAGFVGSTVNDLADQNVTGSFTFPPITGANLSGSEAYYTGPNGTGTQYLAGDVINFEDFLAYPITIYIYDGPSPGCESQEDFSLIIACVQSTFYADSDNDGFGDPNSIVTDCSAPTGYVDNDDDCDDTNINVSPNALEVCDGIDNDCDGMVDEGFADTDGDGIADCIDVEVCDGLDNDGDGAVDEGLTNTYYADTDNDGFGDAANSIEACSTPDGYVDNDDDCDDTNNTVFPDAPEICDGLDNNCDGVIDEGVTSIFYADTDNDGLGDVNNIIEACSAPDGYVDNNDDCNDTNNTVYPNAPELCDGIDNDCDGTIDEGVTTTYYTDTDGDGFGDVNATGVEACSPPNGTVDNNDDCNDTNDTVYPGAPEICDGLDNNCDGVIDEGVTTIYYTDADGDGFGDVNATGVEACSPPNGTVDNNDDCDDDNASVYPNAPELCDGIDNDCDGQIEEPELNPIQDQESINSYTLPSILGENLSGNQAFYTEPNGTGTQYFPGDTINFEDFSNYPITLYTYDSYDNGCSDEVEFNLIIIKPLDCTALISPFNGELNVFTDTSLSWDAVENATGYLVSIGTSATSFNIVDNQDVGNVLSYEPVEDLPTSTTIYVRVIPYNNEQTAQDCFINSFTTYRGEVPPPFFTPNGDGNNDFWIVPDRFNRVDYVQIFDRYGKILTEVSGNLPIWDGRYNGNLMPASDYWYLIIRKDGSQLKGHFALKR